MRYFWLLVTILGVFWPVTALAASPSVLEEDILAVRSGSYLNVLDLQNFAQAPGETVRVDLPFPAVDVRVNPGKGTAYHNGYVLVPGTGKSLSVSFRLPLSSRSVSWLKTFPYPVNGHLFILVGAGVQLPVIINQAFYDVGKQTWSGHILEEYATVKPLAAGGRLAINLQLNDWTQISPAAVAAGNILLVALALVFLAGAWLVTAGLRSFSMGEDGGPEEAEAGRTP